MNALYLHVVTVVNASIWLANLNVFVQSGIRARYAKYVCILWTVKGLDKINGFCYLLWFIGGRGSLFG